MSPEIDDANKGGEVPRVSSLVPDLDAVLYGGLLQDGLYVVQGHRARARPFSPTRSSTAGPSRGRALRSGLFITAPGESYERMLTHLRHMRFFDPALIPEPSPTSTPTKRSTTRG